MEDFECSAEIQSSGVHGRGLFATRSLQAGNLIFRKPRPLIATLDLARHDDSCANCFNSKLSEISLRMDDANVSAFDAKKCTACRVVSYCSKSCQSQHWKRSHKHVCKFLSKRPPHGSSPGRIAQDPSNVTLALVEFIALRDKLVLSEQDFISVLQLISHAQEMKSKDQQRYSEAESLAEHALNYLGHPASFPKDFVIQVACAILTNSLTLVAPTCDPLGLVLDGLACLANHSCQPNAFVVMDGPELSFRTLRDISAGEEVFVSYVDNTEARDVRQAELMSRYYFKCDCTECRKGLITTGDTSKSDLDRLIRSELRLAAESVMLATDRIETLHRTLALCQNSGYPVTQQPYPTARNELIVQSIAQGEFDTAWRHALKSYTEIDPVLYSETHNPIRVVHAFRLAKLTSVLADQNDVKWQKVRTDCIEMSLDMPMLAWKCMKEATQQVDKSHGEGTSFSNLVKATFKAALDDVQSMGPEVMAQIEHALIGIDAPLRKLVGKVPY